MTTNDASFPVSYGFMLDSVVSGHSLADFAVVPRALASKHMSLPVRCGIAGHVGPAYIADGDLRCAVYRLLFRPCGRILYPNLLGIFDPILLRRALCQMRLAVSILGR